MGKFVITEEERKHIMGLYEQGQPVDINYIISQSDNDKGVDTFCKSKSGYEVCLMEKSMDKETLLRKYGKKKSIVQGSGYTMIEESGLRQDPEGNYIKSSIWKKS